MRTLVVTQNITVDGVIDAAGDWFTPSGADPGPDDPDDDTGDDTDPDADGRQPRDDQSVVERRQREAADALLVGRLTFEAFRGYWPHQKDDTSGVAAYLDGVRKYVVSATLDDPGWANSHVLRGPLVDDVRRLKSAPGKDIVVTGSISLVHALTDAGLVDEYRLFVHPVVLGRGRRLFADGQEQKLTLLEARSFHNGVVLHRYRTA